MYQHIFQCLPAIMTRSHCLGCLIRFVVERDTTIFMHIYVASFSGSRYTRHYACTEAVSVAWRRGVERK